MPAPEYEVVHSIPGRVRLRIRGLKHDVGFAIRLQALVSALKPVTEVRVDPAAATIVIHYGKNSLPPAQLLEQLGKVIDQAADLALTADMEVEVPGYLLQGLTAYEYLQVQEIMQWRQKSFSDPVIGVVMGMAGARAMIKEASTAARREFQLRWLLDNQQGGNRRVVRGEVT